jgi:hypothetical protein
MSELPFDTLKLAIALREKAHLSQEQAEAAAQAIAEAMRAHVATREDLHNMKSDLLLCITAAQMDIVRKVVAVYGMQTLAIIGAVIEITRRWG